MDQIATLIEIGAWSAIVAAPIIALVRFLAGSSDITDAIELGYREAGWPRGVQEQELVPWRVEFLRRHRPAIGRFVPNPEPRDYLSPFAGSSRARAAEGLARDEQSCHE